MKEIHIYCEKPYKSLGDLYGLFFEDINHAADGGLYAEMVQNRSFEFDPIDRPEYHSLYAWEKNEYVEWEVKTENPIHPDNSHYLHIKTKKSGFIKNAGFLPGMYFKKDEAYRFCVYIRCREGESVRFLASLCNETGKVLGAAVIETKAASGNWTFAEAEITATEESRGGSLRLSFEAVTECDLDMISLFPTDTFLGKRNGLRRDLAEALRDMHPKFMRFPGGCLTHDGSLNDHDRNSMYRWKRTIGPIEARPSWRNNWGYNQTLGLGYYEYFCFCEEIGAKPLPVLPGGFNPHKGEGVPVEQLKDWVDDALDLIEFANGEPSSKWGSIRAGLGHSKPFGLTYIGIGNEEIGEGFFERYPYFHKAIREKYPDIKIINTAGPFAVGEGYEAGWSSANEYGSDLVDEHYYSSPEWFFANMHHYDDFPEDGPKVFLGEYASWGNTFYNALVEAAYMTHLEKAKAVALACYAPMLCNVNYVNWKPDMLWFDNASIVKTPNYHVQKMFMEHQGTDEVEVCCKGMEERISLLDESSICGELCVERNEISGNLWNIELSDDATGEKKIFEDTILDEKHGTISLGQIKSDAYTLRFKFKRTSGRKGLKIFFGRQSEGTSVLWEFGGWDNWDCNISSLRGGRASTISHRIFHVEDIEYDLQLKVKGRKIETYVNGVLYNSTTDHLPEIEELYVAASVDKGNGHTILKAVNLTGDTKQCEITLHGVSKDKGSVIQLKSSSLDLENTFEKPDAIAPEMSVVTTDRKAEGQTSCLYSFPPHSVSVMIF